ncbi:hypothetical protein [Sphingomonas glacialis]|uniref:Uncharacterized protein n=1 Tax=Sphingomonas glacialis TaxID=658225 RepID=A0A502FY15_9SPHN|nr:hypothetical protein [Sphingomonas glacialis]TPG54230.1 hypothetical protein EAH76_05955 [Sphingomonas glacialis]
MPIVPDTDDLSAMPDESVAHAVMVPVLDPLPAPQLSPVDVVDHQAAWSIGRVYRADRGCCRARSAPAIENRRRAALQRLDPLLYVVHHLKNEGRS